MTVLPVFVALAAVLVGLQLAVNRWVPLEKIRRLRPLLIAIPFTALAVLALARR